MKLYKNGSLLQRRKEADSQGRGGVYKVLDIKEEQFENFGKSEVVILGNLATNELKTFTGQELTKKNGWKTWAGQLKHKMVSYFELPNGKTQIVKEVPWTPDPQRETALSRAMKDAEANLVHDLDHPEQTPTKFTDGGSLKEIPVVEKKTVIVNNIQKTEDELPEINTETTQVDFRFASTYTYHEINLLGHNVKGNMNIEKIVVGGFYKGSKEAHKQMLCRWKEGNISIGQLCKEAWKLDGSGKLKYNSAVQRLLKAIFHFGTDADRKHFDW